MNPTVKIDIAGLEIAITTLDQNIRLLEKIKSLEQSRGGVFGVEGLKSGVSVIASAVRIATGQADVGALFGVVTSAYNAFTQWRTMWDEVRELDWDDALELGKHVASEILPFISGLFGAKDVHSVGANFAVLEQYTATTRSINGDYSNDELAAMGKLWYGTIMPNLALEGSVA
jgi:CxxC motif-containing protein